MYSRRNEEYIADFVGIAKRTLDPHEYKLFRFRFLLGADEKLCARQLGVNVGRVNHAVDRVQQKLGRAYRETQPYGLFPWDEYFGDTVRTGKTKACILEARRANRLMPALAAVGVENHAC